MSANSLSITMPTSSAAPKGRVLCVDDEPNILRALSWLLKKEFHVVTAVSAQEGLALVRNSDFDVVISDQRMPEMSGVDFLNEVRQLAPRAMRILLTGYSDMQAVLRSVNESEIFRFINKPWNVEELPAIVAQAAEIARRQESEGEALAPADEPSPNAISQPTRLLVLDDDEATHSAVEMSAGDLGEVIHVTNPAEAFGILEKEEIGVILAERNLGTTDLTHLLCLLKRQHPQIVSIVLTSTMDSNLITRMINQGQIYRFIPKPVKAGYLRLTLKSAIARHNELRENPRLGLRYQVALPANEDLATAAGSTAAPLSHNTAPAAATSPESASPTSLISQVGGFLRRMLGS
ncbi:MAG: response regulator [Rhodocyclales bacterium GT-UBC]|nr:MAG: response regulator [Rhodocyclales bacterium GT-UBC]